MYKRTTINDEIDYLKKLKIVAFSGFKQSKIIISTESVSGNRSIIEYYFSNKTEYKSFYRKLRKIVQEEEMKQWEITLPFKWVMKQNIE